MKIRCLCLSLALIATTVFAQQVDLNVTLMKATFELRGQAAAGGMTLGTAFLLMKPVSGQQAGAATVTGKLVLITAAHVLEEMVGEDAIILLRSHPSNSENWSVVPAHFKIRRGGQPLWKQHPSADVAVMYVRWPFSPEQPVVTSDLLATDKQLKDFEVVPGVELKSLGYPLGAASNDARFPILRTGVIASYPLLPTATTKTFLFDFRVFKGNSGGPVYFSQPIVKGGAVICCPPQFIMGLVSEERVLPVSTREVYETRTTNLQLSLGVVVHAAMIREAISMLPPAESPESMGMMVPIELVENR